MIQMLWCLPPWAKSADAKNAIRIRKMQLISVKGYTLSLAFYLHLFTAITIVQAQQKCTDIKGQPGVCMRQMSCEQQTPYQYAVSLIDGMNLMPYKSTCGFEGAQNLICCSISSTNSPLQYGFPINTLADFSNGLLFRFGSLNSSTNAPVATIFNPTPPTNQFGSTSTVYQPIPKTPTVYQPIPKTPTVYQPIPATPTVNQPISAANGASKTTTKQSVCGISKTTKNRVVGGTAARKGSYPWIAALGYKTTNFANAVNFLCAGSLISSKYILTSAHCVNENLTLARLGAHLLIEPNGGNAIDIPIRRYVAYELYDEQSIANDIALVELSKPAPNSDFIGTICLPVAAEFLNNDFVGHSPFIAGWGSIRFQGSTSNVLQEAQVPIVDRATCEQNYKQVFQFVQFSEKLICAGNSMVDACQGDSGGPLMLPQRDESGSYRYYLLGVVSYGYECARPGFPGVYSRVASYLPWIKSHIN